MKILILIAFLFAESNSHIHNSTSDEESAPCVSCVTKSNILHNIETDKVNEATITPLQDLFNQAENNNSRMTRQKKRKLLSIDKGKNANVNVIFVSLYLVTIILKFMFTISSINVKHF